MEFNPERRRLFGSITTHVGAALVAYNTARLAQENYGQAHKCETDAFLFSKDECLDRYEQDARYSVVVAGFSALLLSPLIRKNFDNKYILRRDIFRSVWLPGVAFFAGILHGALKNPGIDPKYTVRLRDRN